MGWRMCHVFMLCSGSPWLCTRQTILKSAAGTSPVESPSHQNASLVSPQQCPAGTDAVTDLCCPFHPQIHSKQQPRTRVMGSVMPGLDKGGGPAMVLVALLTPWQAQWVLSSTSQAEGGEGDLGQSSGEQICPKTKRKGLKLLSEFCPAPLSFFCL